MGWFWWRKRKKERKDEEILEPEIREKDQRTSLAIRGQERREAPLATTLSTFSSSKILNKRQERAISSFRKVVAEEQGLANDMVEHSKALDRLRDIDVELKTERLKRRSRLLEEERKQQDLLRELSFNAKKGEIREKELESQLVELDDRINKRYNFSEENREREEKIRKIKREFDEDLRMDEMSQEHKANKMAARLKGMMKAQQVMDRVFDEIVKEFLKGRDPSRLSGQEKRRYDNLIDLYDRIKDKVHGNGKF